jgi:hypothetical protein
MDYCGVGQRMKLCWDGWDKGIYGDGVRFREICNNNIRGCI